MLDVKRTLFSKHTGHVRITTLYYTYTLPKRLMIGHDAEAGG